jgi:VanZ family protein
MPKNSQTESFEIRRNRYLFISIAIILLATMMPGGSTKSGIPHVDKLVHFGIFMFLSMNLCFKFWNHKKLSEVLMLSIFFGLMTEVIQQFIPGRDMDIYDGLTDVIGIIAGFYFYQFFKNFVDRIFLKVGA